MVFFVSITSRANIPIDLLLLLLRNERRQGSLHIKLDLTPIHEK